MALMVVGAAVALMVVVAVVHRVRDSRRYLLWCAAGTMLLSALLREYGEVFGNTPALDLIKRLVFLVTEASVVALLLTFRRRPVPRRCYLGVWGLAGAVGLVECLLVVVMPTHADGSLYTHAEASRSLPVVAYYGLYEITIAATVALFAAGCIALLTGTRQSLTTCVALTLVVLAAGAGVVHACLTWLVMVADPGFNYQAARGTLFLVTVGLLALSLGVGGSHVALRRRWEALMVRVGTEIVEPMWRVLTPLYPGLVLALEDPPPRVRFLRLMIETNDVIHRLRYGKDPAVAKIVEGRDPREPGVTAEVLLHLLGDAIVPGPLSWRARAFMRLITLVPQDIFTLGLCELYELRRALAARVRETA